MPVKNFLTQEQRVNLQKALKESEDSHFRQRVLMLLLMNQIKIFKILDNFLTIFKTTSKAFSSKIPI